MNIAVSKSRIHPDLLDATIRYTNGIFQFLSGLVPEQIELLKSKDEDEAREIASAKWAVKLPSLRGRCA